MSDALTNHYQIQAANGLSHFSGTRYQKGFGLGSILMSLFRSAILPSLKSTGKYLSRQAAKTAVDVGKDLLAGQAVKYALKQRGKETGDRILEDANNRINITKRQSGQGLRKRRLIHKKLSLISPYKKRKIHSLKRPSSKSKKHSRAKNIKKSYHKNLLSQLNKNLI